MTLANELQNYLDTSGESRRSLSLRAGLNPKAVSDILNIPGLQPRYATLVALSDASGRDLLNVEAGQLRSYAELIAQTQDAALRSKLRWLCRNAGWAAELKVVCKQDVIDFFDAHTPASFDLSKGSYATYRSALIKAVSEGQSRKRGRRVDDIGGLYKDVHAAIKDSDLSMSSKTASGPFLLFLHDEGISPRDISTGTLSDYYCARVETSAKSAAQCEKHVREIASLLRKIADHSDLKRFGFTAAAHPFACRVDKFGVNPELIAPLLDEFDTRIAPWALGHCSRHGLTRDAFIASLDDMERPVSDKKAKLRNAKKTRLARSGTATGRTSAVDATASGFLVGNQCWSEATLRRRRGYVVALSKAIIAATDVVPETLEELTDPEFLEVGAEALSDGNKSEYPSGYVASVLKAMRKVASGYVVRSSEDISAISELIQLHDARIVGIAPRNKAKLQQFTDGRIAQTIQLSDVIIADVNKTVDLRRRKLRNANGNLPSRMVAFDAELIRDVMAALAHDILMSRAPRSDNILRMRLEWIAWRGDKARLIVPSVEVKMRGQGDPDLVIPLSESTSRLLRTYLDVLRPQVLRPGDLQNPYLFPGQGKGDPGTHYATLLKRVTRLLARHVGVHIHPHLYRHLIGWIWLKESSDHLPKVQRLLGHKSLQTTLDYYAELDDALVLNDWQQKLNQASQTGASKQKGRPK